MGKQQSIVRSYEIVLFWILSLEIGRLTDYDLQGTLRVLEFSVQLLQFRNWHLWLVLFYANNVNLAHAKLTPWLSSPCQRTGFWARCPRSLPSRKVSDESLGRDETSCVRLTTNNVLSQGTYLSTFFTMKIC